MTTKKDFNKPAKADKKADKPKRDAGTWIGLTMLVGMGMICSAGAIGGVALAITSFATQPGMAFGGIMLSGGMGYILPYLVTGINELLNPGESKMKSPTTEFKKAGI